MQRSTGIISLVKKRNRHGHNMVAMKQVKLILICVFTLATQTTTGTHGQCSTPPENMAVYVGTSNTIMTCNSSTKISWMLIPTSDGLRMYNLVNYSDIVAPQHTKIFGVNQTGLIIKIAQGKAIVPPISTAGVYIIKINGTNRVGAKLLVVHQPPACNCATINSTKINISCIITYADSMYHPIEAKMTWTSNGNFYRNDTPIRKKVNWYLESTSTITVKARDSTAYQCTVTFRKPTNIQFVYVATNAPKFSASCTALCAIAPCTAPLKNIVISEGDLDTLIYYPARLKGVKWTNTITTEESFDIRTIVNYDDAVNPRYAEQYSFDPLGLTIKQATTRGKSGPQLSTAGLYSVECDYGMAFSFKILVVRQGPTGLLGGLNLTHVEVMCSCIYADTTDNPIAAIFTMYVDGVGIASDTPDRTKYDAFTYISLSAFAVAYNDSSTYECGLTFGQPTEIQDPFIAMNEPTFNRKSLVTAPVVSVPCSSSLDNIAINEGELNTLIQYPANPKGIKWTTTATTDELAEVTLINYSDTLLNHDYVADYAFDSSGLTVKNATTTAEKGHRLSTAGLYTVECDNWMAHRFKILVVRQGPTGSMKKLNSTHVELSCSCIYADITYNPIAAIFTLLVNGYHIASHTPERTRNDALTYKSSSTFATAYSAYSTYQCSLTFGQPTEIQVSNIAMNAPTFNWRSPAISLRDGRGASQHLLNDGSSNVESQDKFPASSFIIFLKQLLWTFYATTSPTSPPGPHATASLPPGTMKF